MNLEIFSGQVIEFNFVHEKSVQNIFNGYLFFRAIISNNYCF